MIDDFEDGRVNEDVFSPIGNAVIAEENGKLRVTVFSVGDGLAIRAPKNATCLEYKQTIVKSEFDRGEALSLTARMADGAGGTFDGFQIEMGRPFWNFCLYNVRQADGTTQDLKIFCGRGLSSEEDCPTEKNLRLDWLPPEQEGGKDRFVYEVRQTDGSWRNGKTRESDLSHEDGAIEEYTLTFTGIDESASEDCPRSIESCGFTFEIDDLLIQDSHEPDLTDTLLVSPSTLVAGEVLTDVALSSPAEDIFDQTALAVSLGAGVLVSNVRFEDARNATVDVELSSRVVGGVHPVAAESPGYGRMGYYQIDGLTSAPANSPPTISLMGPVDTAPAGQPIEAGLVFDDPDADFVETFAAVKDLALDEIIFRARRQVMRTDTLDPEPEVRTLMLPALEPGDYMLLGIVDDGVANIAVAETTFVVSAP